MTTGTTPEARFVAELDRCATEILTGGIGVDLLRSLAEATLDVPAQAWDQIQIHDPAEDWRPALRAWAPRFLDAWGTTRYFELGDAVDALKKELGRKAPADPRYQEVRRMMAEITPQAMRRVEQDPDADVLLPGKNQMAADLTNILLAAQNHPDLANTPH